MLLGSLRQFHGKALIVLVALAGCSAEPPLEIDPGASPFAPATKTGGTAIPEAIERETAAERETAGRPLNTALGTNEVERQVRLAMSLGEKGELAKSAALLDQVLVVEPIHREALFMRGVVAIELARRAPTAPERDQAAAKAKEVVGTLERAYEKLKKNELELLNRVRFAEVTTAAEAGRIDQAVALLGEATRGGYDTLERTRTDPALTTLKESPGYKKLISDLDKEFLAKARERTASFLAQPINLPFDFKLPDINKKTVSLSDFKGKVVIVDFWGTWCGPCVQSIPYLMELYKRKHDKGLEIVGLTYEKGANNEDEARDLVAAFVKKNAVPYPCLLGDEKTITQVPGFKGFPTSLVIDRSGKVRLLITDNDENSFNIVRDIATVLVEEPVSAPPTAKGK